MIKLIISLSFILIITYITLVYVLGYSFFDKKKDKPEVYDPITLMNNAENRFFWGQDEKYRK
jgi:hypothetical protein